MRPITTRRSGSGFLFTSLLDEPGHGIGQLCTLPLPECEAFTIDAQAFTPLRRLRIVKPQALDEAAVTRKARISNDKIEKRAFFGAPASQSNHYHVGIPGD